MLTFDPDKDAVNVVKHGISLARAADIEGMIVELDVRFTSETRYRGWGTIDGLPYCLAFTLRGDNEVRAISLRRAHLTEYERHAS